MIARKNELVVNKLPLYLLFINFLLKRMIHCWKKNHFQNHFFIVFVPVILVVLVDVFVVLNFWFSRHFVAMDFDYPMSHFLSHSMICSLRTWHLY
jgi:hypothetical protein